MDVRKSLRGTAVLGVFGFMMLAVPQTWGATGTLQGSPWPKFDGKKCPVCRTSSEKFEKIV